MKSFRHKPESDHKLKKSIYSLIQAVNSYSSIMLTPAVVISTLYGIYRINRRAFAELLIFIKFIQITDSYKVDTIISYSSRRKR